MRTPGGPFLEPAMQRLLVLTGRSSQDQVLDADVLVEIRPVNPLAAPDQTPVAPLVRSAMQQAWIPCEGHRDRPPIVQVNRQGVFTDGDVLCPDVRELSRRSIHTNLSEEAPGSLRSTSGSAESLHG